MNYFKDFLNDLQKTPQELLERAAILYFAKNYFMYQLKPCSKESIKKHAIENHLLSVDNFQHKWNSIKKEIFRTKLENPYNPKNPTFRNSGFYLDQIFPELYNYLYQNLTLSQESKKYCIRTFDQISLYTLISEWNKFPFCSKNQYGMSISTIKYFLSLFEYDLCCFKNNPNFNSILNFHFNDYYFSPYLFSNILESFFIHPQNDFPAYYLKYFIIIFSALQYFPSTELKMYYFKKLDQYYWEIPKQYWNHTDNLLYELEYVIKNIFLIAETKLPASVNEIFNKYLTKYALNINREWYIQYFQLHQDNLILNINDCMEKFEFFNKKLKESLSVNVSHLFYHHRHIINRTNKYCWDAKSDLINQMGIGFNEDPNTSFPYNQCYLDYLWYKNK